MQKVYKSVAHIHTTLKIYWQIQKVVQTFKLLVYLL